MPPHALASIRSRLEHALLALAEQDDDDGALLRQDVRSLLNVIGLMVDTKRGNEALTSEMLSRGHALIERIRAYADRERVYLGSGTQTETEVLSSDVIRRMLADMHPGATEPPEELQHAIIEAAEGPEHRHDTVPVPAPPETLAEFDDEEGGTK